MILSLYIFIHPVIQGKLTLNELITFILNILLEKKNVNSITFLDLNNKCFVFIRYCYVQVQPNANIESVANELNETIFQHEKLRVEIKESQFEEKAFPECIDPYT